MANLLFNQFNGNSYSSYYGDINPLINKELNFNRNRLTNIGDPVNEEDAVNLKKLKQVSLSYGEKHYFSANIHGDFSYRDEFFQAISDNNGNNVFESGHSFILLNYTSTIYHSNELRYGCKIYLTTLRDNSDGAVLHHYDNYKADVPETVTETKYVIPSSWGNMASYWNKSSNVFLYFSAGAIQSGSGTVYLSTSRWYQYIDVF